MSRDASVAPAPPSHRANAPAIREAARSARLDRASRWGARASAWFAEALVEAGYEVDHPAYGLQTAFEARYGRGPLRIAICAEYDALPGVGHACGHNVIAAAALGASFALRGIADDAGLAVSILGTPTEERGGGKILLLERGAFAGIHAASLVHPWPFDVVSSAHERRCAVRRAL